MYSTQPNSVFSYSKKTRIFIACCLLVLVSIQALVPKGYMLGDLTESNRFIVICSVNGIQKIPLSGLQINYSVEMSSSEEIPSSSQHADELCTYSSLNSVVFNAIEVYKDYYLSQVNQFIRFEMLFLVSQPSYLFPIKRGPPLNFS